ncbi:MAG: class I SAM-dependent methyltransferase [Betaproteobacteria bacterium]|nr:class I SAM-dependent methyltransferase [Betaproteobacteria bacterium]
MLQGHILNLFEQRLQTLGVPVSVEFWNGKRVGLGDKPRIKMALRRPAALKALAKPGLGKIAQAYVEGDIDLDCDIHDLVEFAESWCGPQQVNLKKRDSDDWKWWWHTRFFDRRAISQHYDVSNDFFALWLDRQRVYSCAYFRNADDSLDLAQRQKIDHICRKLNLQPGERLLDIGCGWGALIFRAAEQYRAYATGITLSKQQYVYVQEQIRARNLGDRCEVRLLDYRDIPEDQPFDKIASVGMFEHVGKKRLPDYFAKIYRLLKPGGLLMNHGLTSAGIYSGGLSPDVADFIERYVFPGGEIPHLSKEIELMAREKLECLDVECLRPHYARTLWHWAERLDARKDEARALVGEKKYRIWRVYMAGYALAFQRGWVSVNQVLAGRPLPSGALSTPLTREHVYCG